MADILFYPPFPSRPQLFDQLFRSVWHFLPALQKIDRLVFPYSGDDYALLDTAQILSMAKLYLNRDLDPAIADFAPSYQGKVEFPDAKSFDPARYRLKGIVVWQTSDQAVTEARRIAAQTGAEIVFADPATVQQETLLTIRFVYQLFEQSELEQLVMQCYRAFQQRLKAWKGKSVAAFGNGPSLAKVVSVRVDPKADLRMICNSTLGDEAALDHLNPEILFCGDPVQHCGASLYAGKFRQDMARAMEVPSRVLITQLGYVPYFRLLVPESAHERIIGIGNDRRPKFNLDLTQEFLTAATANIFTMLVLPVALTISKQVDIYGCDGMSFAVATKPWSHANEDDYMGKMAVTHRVHGGFWRRNYEEEFWSYCQDMEDILAAAAGAGASVRARTPSFVPALAKRYNPIST